MFLIIRLLAISHVVWGSSLVLLAVWGGSSFFRVLPQMSTGTLWTNAPGVFVMAFSIAVPLGALGVWNIILGKWTWTRNPKVRSALLATHGPGLFFGCLAIAYGIFALYAAEASAAKGGGLMGGIGMFPLVFGLCASGVSLASIIIALVGFRNSAPPRTRG